MLLDAGLSLMPGPCSYAAAHTFQQGLRFTAQARGKLSVNRRDPIAAPKPKRGRTPPFPNEEEEGMDFTLFVGDYAYSSWSLRGWLLLDAFGVPFTLAHAHMRTPGFEAMRARMAPARLVPALAVSDRVRPATLVWETLAIAETVNEYHPQAGLWPRGDARPVARSLAGEMHAGFRALRQACPMNMRRAYAGFSPGAEVRADLDRLAQIWAHARRRRPGGGTAEGPFLFGAFCAADAFFAPVASRIATYGLEMGAEHMAYVAALLSHPSVRRWRAMAVADSYVQPQYEFDLPPRPGDDPYAPPVAGRAVSGRDAENAVCPFTGRDPLPELQVEVRGRVLGFADAFARDKVAADPLAWPEVAALLR
jgi:glutathione S-transferase